MDRKKLMKRLDRLEPRVWYIEDLSETLISIYGFQGIEEVIQESGIDHIKKMLKDCNVPESIKEQIREYFGYITRNKEV